MNIWAQRVSCASRQSFDKNLSDVWQRIQMLALKLYVVSFVCLFFVFKFFSSSFVDVATPCGSSPALPWLLTRRRTLPNTKDGSLSFRGLSWLRELCQSRDIGDLPNTIRSVRQVHLCPSLDWGPRHGGPRDNVECRRPVCVVHKKEHCAWAERNVCETSCDFLEERK